VSNVEGCFGFGGCKGLQLFKVRKGYEALMTESGGWRPVPISQHFPARILPRRASFATNRPRARRRARAREAINLIQSWIVGMTAKGAAIHRTTRCHVTGRRYFAEPPLNGLKPDSPGAARLSSPKSSPYPSPGRGDVARSASPQDRRPTKQTERSGHTNPVQLMPPRFEHEHGDEHEHDLVADLGVRLRRAQSSRSVERSAPP